MIRGRRGWTMVELLTVMILMGLLATIAVLKYIDLKHRALSAQATSDLQSVRLAAYSAYYENGAFPSDAGAGVVPGQLIPYLPKGFSFARSEYVLDWENMMPAVPGPSAGMQLGVVLTSTNQRLARTLGQTLGDKAPFFMLGNALTFVIIGPDGKI
jgi:prepilin-type N-terminal cleavage/methylation domain-containing protein